MLRFKTIFGLITDRLCALLSYAKNYDPFDIVGFGIRLPYLPNFFPPAAAAAAPPAAGFTVFAFERTGVIAPVAAFGVKAPDDKNPADAIEAAIPLVIC